MQQLGGAARPLRRQDAVLEVALHVTHEAGVAEQEGGVAVAVADRAGNGELANDTLTPTVWCGVVGVPDRDVQWR